ncbi:MAG: 3-isopropylmalate dehydratase small subunit [Firmicutes bacterium]|nr:3-isopropylmalate dehydratase small subunit [Bacillota bacterium]
MVKGRVFKFGDDVNTDVIIPARYLNDPSLENMAKHCMEDIDPEFPKQDHTGDIMVGGWNFGCGSSREHAPVSIKACGVSCVIAASFARIFYRNAINIGFPILECPEASEAIAAGDTVSVDFETGTIIDETTGQEFKAAAFPPFIQKIIKAGGLINYRKEEGKAKNEL